MKSDGLPIPGAAVTATQGEKKLTTTTDEQGAYSFPDLENGAWTITRRNARLRKISREVTIASAATAAEWDLQLSPLAECQTANPPPLPGKQRNAPANRRGTAAKDASTAKNGSAPNQPNSGRAQPWRRKPAVQPALSTPGRERSRRTLELCQAKMRGRKTI